MIINFMTSAKGGVGKTLFNFLYFLDVYKNKDDRKYIFIDLNYSNPDLFNIFMGLHEVSKEKISSKSLKIEEKYNWYQLIKERAILIWNNNDHYFPNGISELIDSLKKILDSEVLKNEFLKDIPSEKVEVFVDTNLHVKNLYPESNEENIKKNFIKFKDSNIRLRILFVWSFSLLLSQRSPERKAIKETIENLADIFEDDKNYLEKSLIQDGEKDIQEMVDGKRIKWSIDNFFHIFNYYISFDAPFKIRRRRSMSQLERIYKRRKHQSKGISFYLLDKIIQKANVVYSEYDKNDLNVKKAKIIGKIRERICLKDIGIEYRPKNISIIPFFDAQFTGFTEKVAEFAPSEGKVSKKPEKIEEKYDFFYERFLEIINEIKFSSDDYRKGK